MSPVLLEPLLEIIANSDQQLALNLIAIKKLHLSEVQDPS